MNIKFISSIGYQLWPSEGFIIKSVYVGICSPDMDAEWAKGEMFVRAGQGGMLDMVAQLERLIPIVEGDVKDLRPGIHVETLKPKVTISLPPKDCDYEE